MGSFLRLTAVMLVSVGVCPVLLGQEKVVIDPAHSEVHFTLVDVLHTVHGTFQVQQGEVVFNPTDGHASGVIAVDAMSGKSGNSVRDRKMTNEELKAESYKSVTFAPTRVSGTFHDTGHSDLQVHGLFTILGAAHEIDVPMQIEASGNQIHAIGKFDVPYVQWGLKDPSTMMLRVNKEVQIELSLTGTLQH
jgi:polyisoprenoid-binding protein YceI